jgi:hypothetical protein
VGRYSSTFHFHAALTGMLGPTRIGNQVVEVRAPGEQRLLTAVGMVTRLHHAQLPLDSVVGLVSPRAGPGHRGSFEHGLPARLLLLTPAPDAGPIGGPSRCRDVVDTMAHPRA